MPDELKSDLTARVARTGYEPAGDEATTRMFRRSNQASKMRRMAPDEAMKVMQEDTRQTARNVVDLEERQRTRDRMIAARRKPQPEVVVPKQRKPPLKRPTQRPDRGTMMMTSAKRTTRKR